MPAFRYFSVALSAGRGRGVGFALGDAIGASVGAAVGCGVTDGDGAMVGPTGVGVATTAGVDGEGDGAVGAAHPTRMRMTPTRRKTRNCCPFPRS